MLDKNISINAIARRFNITPNKVSKLIKKYNLKKVYIKDKLTKEKLYFYFVVERKTDREIARMYNCSRNTVMKLRYMNSIKKDMRKS